jgi:AAA domain
MLDMADLGQFAQHFAGFRKVMASLPTRSRVVAFGSMAGDSAMYVARGLDRTLAADELNDIAVTYEVGEADLVQQIISDAFVQIEQLEQSINGIGQAKPNGGAMPAYSATLYVFPDPATIPPRQWLFGGHYVRNCVTATVAPGGFGKTTLTLFEMITMALEGRRVWFISGEDPKDEVDRRIAAHCQHHNINTHQLVQNLYVDDRVSFPLQLGTCPRTAVVKFENQWLARLEAEIQDKHIDVTALDPFISFHSVPEGDNGAIDQIVKRLGLIAQHTTSCIEISHHTRKPIQGMSGELTVDDTRGGSAIINAVRSCRVINRMGADEAGVAKIAIDKRTSYVRIDKGKRNMAPSENAQWWHILSVFLPNGDNVQAIERWEFPSAFAGMSQAEIEWVQKLLKETGPRRASSQSEEWLGHDLGRHCGRDTTEKAGAMWANKILGEWVRNKIIKKVPMRDPVTRKPDVPFYAHVDYSGDVIDLEARKAKQVRVRVIGPCPPETVCLHCQLADGEVKRVKNAGDVGSKSETLHEECAEQWFGKNK